MAPEFTVTIILIDALDVPVLESMLSDKDASVRREAANAIAQALSRSRGPDVVPGAQFLMSRLGSESDATTRDAIRESLARMRYGDQAVEAMVMKWLAPYPDAAVILLRNDRAQKITEEQRKMFHLQAWPDDPRATPSATAIEALGIVGDTDTAMVNCTELWHFRDSVDST